MDTAISPNAVNMLPVVTATPSFGTRLAALPARNKLMMGAGLA